ncbi:MAG: F0F1 ATP synthase subunit A [Patescibacteria group bacterium]
MNIPLFAEPVIRIGSFDLTNATLNALVLMVVLVITAFFLRKKMSIRPSRFQVAVETLLDTLFGYFDQVTGSRGRSKKFLPLVGTLFIFILLSNWMGLLPGIGSFGVWQVHEGVKEFIPLFRPAMSDVNLTLAMAIVSVVTSHILGIMAVGFFVHWNRFIQLGTIWKAIQSLKPMNIVTAFVEFIVGLIELVSELAKMLSLSLRLFGNIFAGEVLITVISSIFAYLLPLPFMGLEMIVGIVQAAVFSMLTLAYLTVLTNPIESHDAQEEHAHA